jgi:hypothetical protein
MVFSAGGVGHLARLTHQGRELSMTWPAALPVPVVRGDTATYSEVLPGVDLRVTAHAQGFSELLVVRTRDAATNPNLTSLRFGLSAKGVAVSTAEGGGLVAVDAAGRTVFAAPAPLMWDSSRTDASSTVEPAPDEIGDRSQPKTKPARGAAARTPSEDDEPRNGVGTAVMPVRLDGNTLTITPNRKLLTAPDTVLPIYIDPSWTGNISGNAWTSVWSKHKSSSFWKNSTALNNGSTHGSAGAGRTEDCSGCADHIVRSLFTMNTSVVRGKQIIDAKFRVEQKHSWTCNPKSNAKLWLTGGISSGTTWNNQPYWDGKYTAQSAANRKVGSAHGCAGPGTVEFNATAMVTRAAANNWSTLTVGLRAASEGTLSQWKRFNHASPKLAITYNTAPVAPSNRLSDGKACATGANRPYVRTLTPTLAAKQTDPDKDQGLTTWFYWWQAGQSRTTSNRVSQAAGNNTTVSRPIPASRLVDGQSYVWQAQTLDPRTAGAWSATCEFTVDVTPPAEPSSVTSTDYPPDSPTTPGQGGVGVGGQFAIAAPASGNAEVVGYAWTLDSGQQPSAANQVSASGSQPVTISYRPVRDGVHTLRVWTKDRAGWYSPDPYLYTFKVRAGAGPAAAWTFDEDSGPAADASGHGNTLTLSANASRVPGRSGVGYAVELNGAAHGSTTGPVSTTHPVAEAPMPVRTDSSYTVAAWIRVPSTTGVTGFRTAVAADATRRSPFMLGYSADTNRWRFSVNTADLDDSGLYHASSDAAPVAGRWTHLAGVYDATDRQVRLYVNGTLQTSTVTTPSTFNTSGPLTIGRRMWNGAADGYFTGAVDDVRFYNYVVDSSELLPLPLPLLPTITLLPGDMAPVGGTATAIIGSGDDTNIASYRYSIGSDTLNQTATPAAAGGPVTVVLPTGTAGTVSIYAVAVDGNGRQSPVAAQARLTVTQPATLTGFVTDTEFTPLPGAVVTVGSTGRSAVVAPDGSYTVTGFNAGVHTVRATYGGVCGLEAVADNVDITGETMLDLMLTPVTDRLGYTCAARPTAFQAADQTVVALTGDNAVAQVGLPFAFPFYGQTYRSAWLDTNGLVSFTDPGGSHPYTGAELPAPAAPNALVAPFWDDLVVDAAASVRTATTGTGPDMRFVIEWRNVHRKASAAQRLSFEVILAADGTVTTNYAGLDNEAERGAQAAVGIEAPAGEDGLRYSAGEAVLASGQAVVFDHPEAGSPIEVYDLSGSLVNAAGTPVVGATVRLDPSGLSVTTGAGGAWRFDDLVADSYTVAAGVGTRCPTVAAAQVELTADVVQNLRLGPDYGQLGYACSVGASGYVAASTVFNLTGDDATAPITLPFPVMMHGRSYSSGFVHTNGLVSFGPTVGTNLWNNLSMPNTLAPNAVVAPFWDDLVVDGQASIRTQVSGTAPNRSLNIEWRNVLIYDFAPDRVTFEVAFHEDGRIVFHYGAMDTPWKHGGAATVGIESASGRVAAQYSHHEAALTPNSSITYTPAPAGAISGTVTTAVTSTPLAGRTVTLSPGGATATTGADGGYQFTSLPVGEYTVQVSTGDNRCAGQHAAESVSHTGGVSDVDLSVMVDGDEFGYKCTTGAQAFVSGNVVEDWSGADTVWPKNPPFPVKLYGNTYTSAWISANGLITFRDPMYFGWIGYTPSAIPSATAEGVPNAAVYPMWDDWVVDSQARIATRVSGSAPNRQWVVEWRNVHHAADTTARVTFEVIFNEGGGITFAYADINAANSRERGSGALVGIENASGTIGFQYAFNEQVLASGQGVHFAPNPPGTGTIAGTVTCQGNPVADATVAVAGQSTTTGADGTYQVGDVTAGTYAVVASMPSGQACRGSQVGQATVGTNTAATVDFAVAATPAGAGYLLTEQAVPYSPADTTVLALTGDDAYRQINLPFPVMLYGQSYGTGWVDTNGLVSLIDPGEPSPDAWPIPSGESPGEPNAAVYPFWHDWVVDQTASVRTATRGTAPNRQFVVEWRDVHSYEDPTTRITFQVIFDEAGGYSFAYADNDGTYLELGGGATIGIENADGTVALQYTYRQPVLHPGLGLRISPVGP